MAEIFTEFIQAVDEFQLGVLARKLGSVPVHLEFVEVEDARGQVFKRNGQYILQVDPQLETNQFFKTFLHECAHLRLHQNAIPEMVKTKPTNNGFQLSEIGRNIQRNLINQREMEADELALVWYELAGSGSIRKRIKELQKYFP